MIVTIHSGFVLTLTLTLIPNCICVADVCTAQKVTTFPTFFYYENGKFVNEYDGDNTKEQFVQHVQKGRVKQEL